MRNLGRALVAAAGIAAAVPAAAQYTYAQPGQLVSPPKLKENVLRVNVGVAFMTTGWYCSYGYYYCGESWSYGFTPFLIGGQADLGLGGTSALSFGFNGLIGYAIANPPLGSPLSQSASLLEPTLDYLFRFGLTNQPTLARLRVGGAGYFGTSGGTGGGFRLGGGASFANDRVFGIGAEMVFEGGWFRGYWISSLQLMISPELHF
jgi:hypothetical protein